MNCLDVDAAGRRGFSWSDVGLGLSVDEFLKIGHDLGREVRAVDVHAETRPLVSTPLPSIAEFSERHASRLTR